MQYKKLMYQLKNKKRLAASHPILVAQRNVYRKARDVDLTYKILDYYLSILKIFWFQDLLTRYISLFLVKIGFGGVSSTPSNWLFKVKKDYKAFRAIGFGGYKNIAQFSYYRGANN